MPTHYLTPAELITAGAPAINAMIQLRTGVADDETRHTLNAIVSVCWQIASRSPKHQHLLPDIESASHAAMTGYKNMDAIDVACEIYKALLRTTPRKLLIRAINRAFAENALTQEAA